VIVSLSRLLRSSYIRVGTPVLFNTNSLAKKLSDELSQHLFASVPTVSTAYREVITHIFRSLVILNIINR